MKKLLLARHLLASMLLLIFLIFSSATGKAQCNLLNENFNDATPLSPTDVDGVWYPDRFPPAAFESFNFGGENVLKISIDGDADGAENRPPGLDGTFTIRREENLTNAAVV